MQIIHSINEYFVAFLLEVIALYCYGKLGSLFFQNRGSVGVKFLARSFP